MNIKLANALFNEGVFSDMYKAGFVSNKIFIYREIYLWIHAQLQTRNINKYQAVLDAEIKFGKDKRTIWRALNSFESCDTLASRTIQNLIPTFEICQSA